MQILLFKKESGIALVDMPEDFSIEFNWLWFGGEHYVKQDQLARYGNTPIPVYKHVPPQEETARSTDSVYELEDDFDMMDLTESQVQQIRYN